MHSVNLIARRRALQVTAKRVARAGSVGVLAALVLLSASVAGLIAELHRVEMQATRLGGEAERLHLVLARYERAQRTQERWLDFARFYLQSRQSLDSWRNWLITIQRGLPPDTWITVLDTQSVSTGKTLLIDGRAGSESSVSRFVANLAAAPHAAAAKITPRLNFIRRVTQEGRDVQEFQVAVPLDSSARTDTTSPTPPAGARP